MRIAFVVDGKTVRDLPGADQGAQDGLEAAVARFREAAQALEDRLAAGPVKALRRVGSLMMGAERRVLRELVALDIFDQYIFPHQQVQRDATRMQLAIDALGAGNPVAALDLVRQRDSRVPVAGLRTRPTPPSWSDTTPASTPSSGVARLISRPTSTCGRSTTRSRARSTTASPPRVTTRPRSRL